jgi:hypothetical protein
LAAKALPRSKPPSFHALASTERRIGMTWEIIKEVAHVMTMVTGWALVVTTAWGLLFFAISFAAWFYKKAKEEAAL